MNLFSKMNNPLKIFKQNSMAQSDWRLQVGDNLRNDICNRLYIAACQALPADQKTQLEETKLLTLAKNYEKQTFEKSNSMV